MFKKTYRLFYGFYGFRPSGARRGELLERLGELKIKAFGGYDDAERVMFAMFPDYMDEDEIIFPIDAVRISYNSKFSSSLSHRDFLGSILGLGIERIKVGDILVYDGEALCFSDSSISQYIVSNLERVGHTKVTAQIAALELLNIPEKENRDKKCNRIIAEGGYGFWRGIRKIKKRGSGGYKSREGKRKLEAAQKAFPSQ